MMSSPDPRTLLHVRRLVPARREQVFRAWTQPAELERWFRPMGLQLRVRVADLRVGGAYHFDLQSADHSGDHGITGKFLDITPPDRLVFTWSSGMTNEQETVVTVEFVERGEATEVLLSHERLMTGEIFRAHEGGWLSCLEQLERYFTGG